MADVESVLPRSTGPRIRARRCARRERRRAARHRDRLSGRSLAAAAASFVHEAWGVAPGPAPPRGARDERDRRRSSARAPRLPPHDRGRPRRTADRRRNRAARAHRGARRGPRRADPPHDERPREPPLLPPVRVRARRRARASSRGAPVVDVAPQLARPSQDRIHHRLGQPPRERVLLAGVEAPEQREGPDLHLGAVPEARLGARNLVPELPQRPQRTVPRERPEGDRTRARSSSASSRARYGRQLSRSAGVGLLAGGGQRLTAVTCAPRSRRPSSRRFGGRTVREPGAVTRRTATRPSGRR